MRSVAVVLAVCLVACSSGQPEGDDTTDVAPEIVEIDTAPPVDQVPRGPCAALPDLTGRVYRVTDFVATAPTDGINPTWKKWADVYDLVMLFRVLEHDRIGGTIDAVVACGGATLSSAGDDPQVPEGLFYALEPTPIHFVLDGCDLTFVEPLDIHLFTPWVSAEIPIEEVTGSGSISEDGAEIERLNLSGFLGEDTAASTCIDIAGLGVVNLHWFFNLAAICPDTDTDDDGVLDAYNFLGWVRGMDETPLYQDGVVPIDSQVPECLAHEEPCVIPAGG